MNQRICWLGALLAMAGMAFVSLRGQEATPDPTSLTNLTLREMGAGVFQLGRVTLDRTQREIRFPAVVNMTAGPIEYFLVTESGKTHESVLRTAVEPFQIHTAMLLLGVKGAGGTPFPTNATERLPGDPVLLEVRWKERGKERRAAAEQFVRNREARRVMKRGVWIYNGSRVAEIGFVAQETGSIIALMEDPDALVNNPRPGRERDDIWEALAKGLPAAEAEVEVRIRLKGK